MFLAILPVTRLPFPAAWLVRLLLSLWLFLPFPIHADGEVLAPGYQSLSFTAPEPGTYSLPDIGIAADGSVLDAQARDVSLSSLMAGKVSVLSFIYATCSDINGCPLATAVLHQVKSRLRKEPELAGQLRLLTLSFNPEHDTPEQMRLYGQNFQGGGVDWQFLTTRSEQHIHPIVEHYQQAIAKKFDDQGRFTGTFAHNLRVYLIDKHQHIRNIYSTGFLHADTLVSDIKTLLLEDGKPFAGAAKPDSTFDLLSTVINPPLGLPPLPVPENNPVTKEKVSLGRKLFYDRRLSLNGTMSCAMCHIPDQGFTSHELATAVGVEGRTVRRNSPALFNVGYFPLLFHDGRESTLEQQIWGPLLARNEMANPSVGFVIDKIKHNADYNGLFEQAYGKPVSMETLGSALASYERVLNSANSAFDRWYFAKDKQVFSDSARRGYALFIGKAGCASCHQINKAYALFTDNGLHNTGIGYVASMSSAPASRRVQLAPGVFAQVPQQVIKAVSEAKLGDLGRYEITQDPADRWRYKTPGLRNVALTAPYMHDGSLASLREVVEFYNRGGVNNENLDSLLKPLHLSTSEIDDLIGFLQSLTGANAGQLAGDGVAAPVGNNQ
ncbi:MAG: photosynthetic protein synthase I [Methylomonas sp.]|nr:MAG: photosynthetic protein synthase I [Methylobacter sp.]PPD35310.1 MAG: photosynthetic protein synthase I [Methylomonas sp.]